MFLPGLIWRVLSVKVMFHQHLRPFLTTFIDDILLVDNLDEECIDHVLDLDGVFGNGYVLYTFETISNNFHY